MIGREAARFAREADLLGGRLVLTLAIAVLPSFAVPTRPSPRVILASSGSCITMAPASPDGYTLTNTCGECRTALVSWCDGNAYPFDVSAHRSLHIEACRGFQMLQSDVPCAHGR